MSQSWVEQNFFMLELEKKLFFKLELEQNLEDFELNQLSKFV